MSKYTEALELVGLRRVTEGAASYLTTDPTGLGETFFTATYDSSRAPSDLEEPTTVTFQSDEGESGDTLHEFPTLRAAILDLYGPLANEPLPACLMEGA